MDCRDVRAALDRYLDRDLEPGLAADTAVHLESCAACRQRALVEETVRAALAELGRGERAPEDLRERVRMRVDAAVEARRRAALDAEGPRVASGRDRPAFSSRRFRLLQRSTLARHGVALAAVLATVVLVWTIGPKEAVDQVWAAGAAKDHAAMHGASGTQNLVHQSDPTELARWFQSQLGASIPMPATPADADLLGGQICTVNDRRVAHAVYFLKGTTSSYYVVPRVTVPREPTPRRIGRLTALEWASPDGYVVVVGTLSVEELASLLPR